MTLRTFWCCPTLAQTGRQHLSGARGDGEEWVVAPLAGVVVALRALLGEPVGLADGGVQVDGQRIIAWSRPSPPGPGQQLPAHPVRLPDVAPTEAAQKGTQRGWRLDHAAQQLLGSTSAQPVGIVSTEQPADGVREATPAAEAVPGEWTEMLARDFLSGL